MDTIRSGITKLEASIHKLAYTRTEAAELLGINPISLDRLAKRGLINPSRALRRPLYPHSELLRFLEETRGTEL